MSISYSDVYTPNGRPSQLGEPTWELTTYFPRQGEWTEGQYLALESRGGRRTDVLSDCRESCRIMAAE